MEASRYDDIAEWYDAWVGPIQEDPYFAEVCLLMGEVAGQRICDLACGQGRIARFLAAEGASVLGLDLSAKLLQIARRREEAEPLGVEYRQADAGHLQGVVEEAFDGVLCNMALMDIPDLAPTLRSVRHLLRPGGWFIFSILHPCYNTARSGQITTPEGVSRFVAGYFNEGYWRSDTRTGPPGKVGAYHRTLSTYLNALADAGLVMERMREARATGSLSERSPGWAEVPAVLAARCRKLTVTQDP
jgi:2-polyprenyl-3-methyl-5-hydroxy-6-metoxy-1,4-benzoquinol methylase